MVGIGWGVGAMAGRCVVFLEGRWGEEVAGSPVMGEHDALFRPFLGGGESVEEVGGGGFRGPGGWLAWAKGASGGSAGGGAREGDAGADGGDREEGVGGRLPSVARRRARSGVSRQPRPFRGR